VRSLELLVCPACRGDLREAGERLVCVECEAGYDVRDGIPDLRVPSDTTTETVRGFYTVAPFPGYPPRDSLGSLRARAGRSEFARLLDRAIPGDANVVEVGCGTGQMSLFLATADRVVIGADLTRASLSLGAAASRRFGVDKVRFVEDWCQQNGFSMSQVAAIGDSRSDVPLFRRTGMSIALNATADARAAADHVLDTEDLRDVLPLLQPGEVVIG